MNTQQSKQIKIADYLHTQGITPKKPKEITIGTIPRSGTKEQRLSKSITK